jgi:AraC-like DNA-binding protein
MLELRRSDPKAHRWGVWFSSSLSTLLPSHRHACPELNVIMSGKLAYRVSGRGAPLEARAGQLVVLPAGVEHELVGCSEDLALWVLELNGAGHLSWIDEPSVLALEARWKKQVVESARGLWLRPSAEDAVQAEERLWRTLNSMDAGAAVPELRRLHPAVVRAKAVCEASITEELNVARLAKESGLSASRLAHLFADEVGVTPLQYRNFVRVQHFIRTCSGDERNLMRAALQSGFGSYAQFHRVFRQVCGASPADHIKWLCTTTEIDAKRTLAATA